MNSTEEEDMSMELFPKPIARLPEDVVNRIAAGEIIHRPANALKEMLENSLDAGAKMIRVQLRDGGLKMLQIQDDGSGIRREDFTLLCERFATSKLSKFEDLSRMKTFGFRGEALASISYVSASMSVISRTEDSEVAYKASYSCGKLVAPKPGQSATPKACAGSRGTFVTAEDLFFNAPQRKQALKNASDEYGMALDIVNKYAIHYGSRGVGFSCKKTNAEAVDLSIPSAETTTTLDVISNIFGSNVAKQLVPLEPMGKNLLNFDVQGYISGPNWNIKKMTFILFINDRFVDSPALKRAVMAVYATNLPKGGHPWIYLSLRIDEANVDVNVHPTKREVHFLYEEEIIDAICNHIQETLDQLSSSRHYATPAMQTQSILPAYQPKNPTTYDSQMTAQVHSNAHSSYPRHTVRIDASARRLDDMGIQVHRQNEIPTFSTSLTQDFSKLSRINSQVDLESIQNLRHRLQTNFDQELTEIFQSNVFVGIVDVQKQLLLIQHETKLFLVKYASIVKFVAYQLLLRKFGEFAEVRIINAPLIQDLVQLAVQNLSTKSQRSMEKAGLTTDQIMNKVQLLLKDQSEMLKDYFSIRIEEDLNGKLRLISVPHLLYTADQDHIIDEQIGLLLQLELIPSFILNLATQIDYDDEEACFDGVLDQLALLYTPLPAILDDEAQQSCILYNNWTKIWQPALRSCQISTTLAKNNAIVCIANTSNLYSVFERC